MRDILPAQAFLPSLAAKPILQAPNRNAHRLPCVADARSESTDVAENGIEERGFGRAVGL